MQIIYPHNAKFNSKPPILKNDWIQFNNWIITDFIYICIYICICQLTIIRNKLLNVFFSSEKMCVKHFYTPDPVLIDRGYHFSWTDTEGEKRTTVVVRTAACLLHREISIDSLLLNVRQLFYATNLH